MLWCISSGKQKHKTLIGKITKKHWGSIALNIIRIDLPVSNHRKIYQRRPRKVVGFTGNIPVTLRAWTCEFSQDCKYLATLQILSIYRTSVSIKLMCKYIWPLSENLFGIWDRKVHNFKSTVFCFIISLQNN